MVSSVVNPQFSSAREVTNNNEHWKMINRTTGDIYNNDDNATIRKKFVMHSVFNPLLAIPRTVTKATHVLTGLSTENGMDLGRDRWEKRQLSFAERRSSRKPGNIQKSGIVYGSAVLHTLKDSGKIAAYALAGPLSLEAASLIGIAAPQTGRRMTRFLDNTFKLQTKERVIARDTSIPSRRQRMRAVINCPVFGGHLATPCMQTLQDNVFTDLMKNILTDLGRSLYANKKFFKDEKGKTLTVFKNLNKLSWFIQPLISINLLSKDKIKKALTHTTASIERVAEIKKTYVRNVMNSQNDEDYEKRITEGLEDFSNEVDLLKKRIIQALPEENPAIMALETDDYRQAQQYVCDLFENASNSNS